MRPHDRYPLCRRFLCAPSDLSRSSWPNSDGRGHLDGVTPRSVRAHQGHYGGLAVNDILAARAEIKAGSRVADFCAGLGGPARYLAHKYGADVTRIDLTPARAAGAEQLTRLVGLQDKVRVLQGDVMRVPLPDAGMDALISQAFLHVPDAPRVLPKRASFGPAFRVHQLGRGTAAVRPIDSSCGTAWRCSVCTPSRSTRRC